MIKTSKPRDPRKNFRAQQQSHEVPLLLLQLVFVLTNLQRAPFPPKAQRGVMHRATSKGGKGQQPHHKIAASREYNNPKATILNTCTARTAQQQTQTNMKSFSIVTSIKYDKPWPTNIHNFISPPKINGSTSKGGVFPRVETNDEESFIPPSEDADKGVTMRRKFSIALTSNWGIPISHKRDLGRPTSSIYPASPIRTDWVCVGLVPQSLIQTHCSTNSNINNTVGHKVYFHVW